MKGEWFFIDMMIDMEFSEKKYADGEIARFSCQIVFNPFLKKTNRNKTAISCLK